MRPLLGLVAAVAAGAWLGFLVEWISSSGGWDEDMNLGAAAIRAALFFAAAFVLAETARRRFRLGWVFVVSATCVLGAALFESIDYTRGSDVSHVVLESFRAFLFTLFCLPVMAGLVVIALALSRLMSWLSTADLPGRPGRSLVGR